MVFNCNYDGLIHFVADNLTHAGFSQISFHDYVLLSYLEAFACSVITVWILAIFLRTSLIRPVLSNWFVAF